MIGLIARSPTAGTALLTAALSLLSPASAAAPPDTPPRIAIIIDDLGHQLAAGRRAVRLPGPVACALLPDTPRAGVLAEEAFAAGKDVLLHLPLQSIGYEGPAEPGSIVLDMTRGELAQSFARSVASIPHLVGVNTHRGSLLTQHPGHMSWLMEEIRKEGRLFFVDSYTTPASIALSIARESGVPAVRRDVFLDPDPSAGTVAREFARLKKVARQHGMAVGIGHPHGSTLALLEQELPKLEGEGFELVSISHYVALMQAGGTTSTAALVNPGYNHPSRAGVSPLK
ncbi:MAG: divergent polysaccharide deacetylase family protein [Woeseiaceae bacterium]